MAVEGGVVAAAMEDVGDLHRLADDPVDDDGASFERHGAETRGQIVA